MLASAQINEITKSAISASDHATLESAPAWLHFQIGMLRETALNLLHQLEGFSDEEPASGDDRLPSLHDEVRRFEIQLITNALCQTQGHQGRAARLLGVKVTTLNSKLKRYKLLPFLRRWTITDDNAAVDDQAAAKQAT